MTVAHDALSPLMQEFLAGLTVVHDNVSFIEGLKTRVPPSPDRDELCRQLGDTFPPVRHPLVRTHPDRPPSALPRRALHASYR